MIDRLVEGFMVAEKLDDQELSEWREIQCGVCDFKKMGMCLQCGCLIKVKVKSYTNKTLLNGLPIGPIEKTHCPLGLWGDKETANYYRELNGKVLI